MFVNVKYHVLVNLLKNLHLEIVRGILAYHINIGYYGDISLDGLNALAIGAFEGNLWAGNTKVNLGLSLSLHDALPI